MSISIDLIELLKDFVETDVEIRVSTVKALEILLQNLKENIALGAPKTLITEHMEAVDSVVRNMRNLAINYKK